MSYQRTEINKFKGLNSAQDPTQIEDGFARDILNFRMEKVGKLVSRDGYIFGAFSAIDINDPETWKELSPNDKFFFNGGIVGIGEMVFSSFWNEIDTDRVMVYMIRTMPVQTSQVDWTSDDVKNHVMGELHKTHTVTFLFVPMSGMFTNVLLTNFKLLDKTFADATDKNGDNYDLIKDFDSSVDNNPQGKYEALRSLYAPNKAIPEVNTVTKIVGSIDSDFNNFKPDHWINQYDDITQYRHQLIVSDKINGDMLVEDEANRTDRDACAKPEHALHIRPNCLAEFDIDVVDIDLCMEEGEENVEVKQGMALYKFVLPKMIQMTSDEVTSTDFSDIENYIEGKYDNTSTAVQLMNKREAYIHMLQLYARADMTDKGLDAIAEDNEFQLKIDPRKRRYTNADNNSEVDNIFGKLEFDKQEYTNEDGEFKEDAISNVYIWEDYQIPYYICSGRKLGFQLYRELDRMFVKTSEAPRIKELNVKDEYGKQVPLGVWRYRFVWDFGDGIYSAPSAEMNVPDLLWSAVQDNGLSSNNYHRPTDYINDYAFGDVANETPDFWYRPISPTYGNIYDKVTPKQPMIIGLDSNSQPVLNTLGKIVFDLKKKLYDTQQHRFGIKTATTYDINGIVSDPAMTSNNGKWTRSEYGDFATIILLNPGETITLKQPFYQTVSLCGPLVSTELNIIETNLGNGFHSNSGFLRIVNYDGNQGVMPLMSLDIKNQYLVASMGFLLLPIFPDFNKPLTANSLCDSEGRIRLAWQNLPDIGNLQINRQLIFPGCNPSIFTRYKGSKLTNTSKFMMIQDTSEPRPDAFLFNELSLVNANINTSEWFASDSNVYINIIGTMDYSSASINYEQKLPAYMFGSGDELIINQPLTTYSTGINTNATYTLTRCSVNTRDTFVRTAPSLSNEALGRLILSGVAEIIIQDHDDLYGMETQYQPFSSPSSLIKNLIPDANNTMQITKTTFTAETDIKYRSQILAQSVCIPSQSTEIDSADIDIEFVFRENDPRRAYKHDVFFEQADDTAFGKNPVTHPECIYNNLDIRVYIPGTRFIGIEQLTAYFPSSLIHKAPRLGLRIENADIPKRAKGIKIFRTLATHSNDWDPLSFGLVDTLKIERDVDGNAITKNKDDDSQVYQGVYFFDDIMDANLDFSDNPDNYDGMRRAIHSRFNVSLNERVYYANFIEIYQALAPRLSYNEFMLSNQLSTNWVVVSGTKGDKGYVDTKRMKYKYAYINEADQYSQTKTTGVIEVEGTDDIPVAVVLYLLPSQYDLTIRELHIFRAIIPDTPEHTYTDEEIDDMPDSDYKYIGKVVPEDEGIFVDDFKNPGKSLGCTKPEIQTYEDGLRWSEPFQPDWIKLNNFAEYRSGDNRGVRITGLTTQYGNLVVFKENSIHRVAVQASDPPLSRTDEISSNIGCIAPNTLINIDNILYFLSSKGFMAYDNNAFTAIDGLFGEELQYVLANNPPDYIRECTCGYNAYQKELYLNVPMMPSRLTVDVKTKDYEEWMRSDDNSTKVHTDTQSRGAYEDTTIYPDIYSDEVPPPGVRDIIHDREILGHIYVISLEKQYVTKFAYTTTGEVGQPKGYFDVRTIDPRQVIRKYYTNSLGEMRSADIIPRAYGSQYADKYTYPDLSKEIVWGGMYIETPYMSQKTANQFTYNAHNTPVSSVLPTRPTRIFTDKDMILDADAAMDFTTTFGQPQPLFPPFKWMAIDSEYRSKIFTGEMETVLKRVRKGLLNIFSKGDIKVSSIVFHNDGYDDRSEEYSHLLQERLQQFLYPPTVDNFNQYDNLVVLGTNTNILSFIPTSDQQTLLDIVEDRYGKPVRYAINVRTSLRTELNAVVFHWRPIHTYLQ